MISKVFIIHHSHLDLGYTDLKEEVEEQYLRNMDRIIDLCELNRCLPSNNRFYWTCESSYVIKQYCQFRPLYRQKKLLNCLREGWIELQSFFTQPLTELASAEELIDNIQYSVSLSQEENFAVEAAMINDIGGYAGCLPTILSEFGIKYFVAGPGAFQVYLPWADLPHLFYLTDKAKSQILVWNLGIDRSIKPQDMHNLDAVYSIANTYLVRPFYKELMDKEIPGIDPDAKNISDLKAADIFNLLMSRLEKENYPYEEIMLQYSDDNGGPDEDLPELVSRINEQASMPEIILGTPIQFFKYVEQKYNNIPVERGVLTDPWNIRANALPMSLKKYRKAQREIFASEARLALWPDIPSEDYAKNIINNVYENLRYYSDHTYGLSEWGWENKYDKEHGCRSGIFDRYRKSWSTKSLYADKALSSARILGSLSREVLQSQIQSSAPGIIVWNNLSHDVSGVTELYLGGNGTEILSVIDPETNKPIPFQCIGNKRYLILSPVIPALGCRRLNVSFGDRPASPVPNGLKYELESKYLKIQLDHNTGSIVSLFNKTTGCEEIDFDDSIGFGDFIYHRVGNVSYWIEKAGMGQNWTFEQSPFNLDNTYCNQAGDILDSIVVEGHLNGMDGIIRISREIKLYKDAPRMDINLRMDKPETKHKEACYIALPFSGHNDIVNIEQNMGSFDPANDLLPGAMQDAFYCYSGVSLSNDNRTRIVSSPDAPLFQLGGIQTGRWDDQMPFSVENNHLYGFIYHNLLNTDVPLWQDILDDYRYSIYFASDKLSEEAAMRKAREMNEPPHAQLVSSNPNGPLSKNTLSLLKITPSSVRVLSIRRHTSESIQLRIEETTGENTNVEMAFAFNITDAIMVNLSGTVQKNIKITDNNTMRFTLKSNRFASLKVKLFRPASGEK